ncbi:MAG: glycosyltransferase family 2 protein [Parvibaculaceae bacterium]
MITFVMPNYNHAAYLDRSISGLLAQTRPADEIIIIDDASTDNSIDIIEKYAARDTRIRLIRRPERRGVVTNLNLGFAEAKGDLIGFLGADDLVFPGFVQTLGALMEQYPQAGFASAAVELQDDDDVPFGERPLIFPLRHSGYMSPDDYRDLLQNSDNHFLGAATLYRRDALNEVGGFDGELGPTSDGLAARRIAVRRGFCFAPQKLGVWRIHGNNYSLSLVTPGNVTDKVFSRIDDVLTREPEGLFPKDYARKFAQRLRFGHGRLLAGDMAINRTERTRLLSVLAGNKGVDKVMMALASMAGPAAPVFSTGWLTLRLRPFSLWHLLVERFHRKG